MSQPVIHTGTVVQVSAYEVDVLMQVQSACATCRTRSVCGMDEKSEKLVTISTAEAPCYTCGEEVEVLISEAMGVKAVLVAYAWPFCLVFALLFTLIQCGVAELFAALSALGVLVLYYVILYFMRNRISREIQFSIRKIQEI